MTNWIDSITGKVTMYRLVLLSLLALLVASLPLSLAGVFAHGPLEILASGAVLLAATYLSNLLFAAVLRVKPHSESSMITALLLLFIFRPSLDLATLGVFALAGALASASKYLLAVRRRHIFNPAAISALAISLFGLEFPVWWVATPWLFPLTLIAAFAILHRTRRIPLGLVFIVLSTVIYTIRIASLGTPPAEALIGVLTSFPIVFLAGFMLSEPLTLPPLRWQQLTLAAIVAVLFSVPFSFGPIYSSPELALVVGNLFAFFAGQRRGIRLEFVGREQLTPTAWEFSFAPRSPVRWTPGQFMELTLPHRKADMRGLRRAFSIASAPSESGVVRFGMRFAERSSSFKQRMLELRQGDLVAATSVGGDFVLPRDASQPLLLVAGGIGITPFVSQLEAIEAAGENRDVVVVYACSSVDEIAYAHRLEQGGYRVLLLAPEAPSPLPAGWTHLNDTRLTGEVLLAEVADARGRAAYLSGPPQLVNQLRKALRRAGVQRVKTDYFTGY